MPAGVALLAAGVFGVDALHLAQLGPGSFGGSSSLACWLLVPFAAALPQRTERAAVTVGTGSMLFALGGYYAASGSQWQHALAQHRPAFVAGTVAGAAYGLLAWLWTRRRTPLSAAAVVLPFLIDALGWGTRAGSPPAAWLPEMLLGVLLAGVFSVGLLTRPAGPHPAR
jgi:peptidoglycan/LPS O-acetylase OafA/YrhL